MLVMKAYLLLFAEVLLVFLLFTGYNAYVGGGPPWPWEGQNLAFLFVYFSIIGLPIVLLVYPISLIFFMRFWDRSNMSINERTEEPPAS